MSRYPHTNNSYSLQVFEQWNWAWSKKSRWLNHLDKEFWHVVFRIKPACDTSGFFWLSDVKMRTVSGQQIWGSRNEWKSLFWNGAGFELQDSPYMDEIAGIFLSLEFLKHREQSVEARELLGWGGRWLMESKEDSWKTLNLSSSVLSRIGWASLSSHGLPLLLWAPLICWHFILSLWFEELSHTCNFTSLWVAPLSHPSPSSQDMSCRACALLLPVWWLSNYRCRRDVEIILAVWTLIQNLKVADPDKIVS